MPIILNGTTGITTPGITNTGPFVFQGVVELPAGAVGAPSLTTTGDTNTGIYFPAADTIAFTEGGVEVARFDSSGNLGIGITTPAAGLQVANGNVRLTNGSAFTTGNALIREINAAAGSSNQFVTSSIGFRTDAFVDSGIITFSTASSASSPTERMRLNASGRLGIGVTSPSYPLHVRVDAIGADTWIGSQNATATNTVGAGFIAVAGSSTHYSTFKQRANGDAELIQGNATGSLLFGTNNTERMRLDSSGNLGLGVTPSAWDSTFKNIQIGGNGFSGSFYSQANGDISNGVVLNAYFSSGWRYTASSKAATRYEQNNGIHTWSVAPSGTAGNAITFTQAMTLSANGRLSIGSTSEAGMVYVNSGALDETLRLQGSGGPYFSMYQGATRNFYLEVSTDVQFWVEANKALRFATNNAERARITSGGNLLVGMTSTPNISVSNSIGHRGAANGTAGSVNMSGSTWVNLVTLPTPSIAGARVNILGNENGNVNTYYGTWIIAYNSSGWGITGPFNENQRGNDWGVPNLRISGSNIQVQARNGVSFGVIYYNIEYFSV